MLIALLIILAIGVCFLARIAQMLVRIFNGALDVLEATEKRRENRRENSRRYAKEALKVALLEMSDPKFKEMDYNLGTGHGYRRNERLLNAKTWDEVEAIASGEDLETYKDKLGYDAVMLRQGR
jgi:hypothetical protein